MATATAEQVTVDQLICLTEAARMALLTRETLARYADLGRIRAVRVGGRRLLVREDLERFIRERRAARR